MKAGAAQMRPLLCNAFQLDSLLPKVREEENNGFHSNFIVLQYNDGLTAGKKNTGNTSQSGLSETVSSG